MFFKILKKDKEMWILLAAVTIMSFIIFHDFILGKKLLIFNDVGCDTYNQYWPGLQYLVHSIHNGTIKNWIFEAGMGTDVFSIIPYILDPFHFFLLFLPEKFIPYGIGATYIARIYFCAVFEYKYLKKINITNEISVIFSIIWAFSGYMILWGQHYHFGSSVVLFTMIIYGLECLIRERKSTCFIIGLSLLMIYSPYFAYQIVIFVSIYYILRYFTLYKFNSKHFFNYLYILLWRGILCLGISAFAFIPGAELISSSSRYGNALGRIRIFNNLKYYVTTILQTFSANMLGSRYHKDILGRNYYATPLLCSSVLCFLFSIEYFLRIKEKNKKVVWIISIILFTIGISTGIVNYIMNGFTNVSYIRWSYMFIFAVVLNSSLCMQVYLDNNEKTSIQRIMPIYGDICFLLLFASLGYIYRYYKDNITVELMKYTGIIVFILTFFALLYCIIFQFCNFKSKGFLWIILIIVCIEMSWANYDTVNNGGSLSAEYLNNEEGYFDMTSEAVKYLNTIDKEPYRIEKMYRTANGNDSFMQNYKGTFYYGLVRSGYFEFMKQLGYNDSNPNRMHAINNNSQLESIVGIKYMLSKEPINKPSYEFVNKIGDIYIYENLGWHSLGYTVNSYLTKEEFEKMSLSEKQENLLTSVVLDSETDKLIKKVKHLEKLDYTLQQKENQIDIYINYPQDNGISLSIPISEKKNALIQIYKDKVDEQNHILTTTLPEEQNAYEITIDQKEISHLIIICDDIIKKDEINILARNNTVNARNNHAQLQIMDFSSTNIKGTIDCKNSELLVFSIPAHPGWKVKIDGEKAEKEEVNYGFWGTYLSEGTHIIEITYFSPYLLLGCIISIFTIIIIFSYFVLHKVKVRQK